MNMHSDYVFNEDKMYILLEEFSDYLQTLNYAAHTINSYSKDLREYFGFLESKNILLSDADHVREDMTEGKDYVIYTKESIKNKNEKRI